MGQILIIKNANFSENAVSYDKLYDVVKETDVPVTSRPLSKGGSSLYINSIPFAKATKIYAVSITLPVFADGSADRYASNGNGYVNISAATATAIKDGNDNVIGLENIELRATVQTDVSNIVRAVAAGTIDYGTTHVVQLSTPLTFNAGEYLVFNVSGSKVAVYSNVPDGEHGYMQNTSASTLSANNLANTFYGFEIEEEE